MTKITACIDGRDMSLAQGSGIATYGRNLVSTLVRQGVDTQVLYGPKAPFSRKSLLNEINLIGPEPNKLKRTIRERVIQAASAYLAMPAYPVRREGAIWPRDGATPAHASSYWAGQDIFRRAHRAFLDTGKIARVDFKSSPEISSPDICHWTSIMPLRGKGAINVYTMHDLIPLKLPHLSLSNKAHYLDISQAVANSADHIIVGSESAREDIIKLLGVDPGRITNTYHSIQPPPGHMERSDEDVAREIEAAFGLEWKNYFLHYGTIEPRKNLGRTVEAYLSSGVTTPLVVAGGDGWLFEPEVSLLNHVREGSGSASQRILKLQYLPAGILASLVRGAKALLFPSLYEGFGLPVLEAMSMGTAVLTSTAGSLPEVAGDAAILVDPYDIHDIREGIATLDHDDALRADLVRRGTAQAGLFSPAAYAQRLSDLYMRLGLA